MTTALPAPRRAARLLSGLLGLLGVGFIWAGAVKIQEPGGVLPLFAAWGLGTRWAVSAAGWIELFLGLALLHTPTRRPASALMIPWMAAFATLQLRAGQPLALLASASVAGLCAAAVGLIPEQRSRELRPAPLNDPPTTPVSAGLRLVQLVGLSFLLRYAVGGVLFWSALPLVAWLHHDRGDTDDGSLPSVVLLYLLVLGLGVSGVWSFVGHTFLSEMVATSVGWDPSPFQHELAAYHLGVGAAGLACWWIRDRFWIATATIPAIFLYGAGLVHLQSFLSTGNTAPGNWGLAVLFGNLLLPTVLLVLTRLRFTPAGAAHRPG